MQNYQNVMRQQSSKQVTARTQHIHYSPRKDTPVSVKYERISPIKPSSANPNKLSGNAVRKTVPMPKKGTVLRDFLFGFTVGLVVFGIAAAIICNALLKLI